MAAICLLLALLRPVDHDESQYVAAAMLVAEGLLPYRDFAYLQTPLQPLLLAPVAALAGPFAWPALRMANAIMGAAMLIFVWRAARIGGADARMATLATGLFACCDIMLFSVGTARNDALPAMLMAAALIPVMQAETGKASRVSALMAGLLLAAAAAAKISYALPAAAYGLHALVNRRHRPALVAAGAAIPAVLVLSTMLSAPEGFRFGVFDFPALAPAEYYATRPWKLSFAAKGIDSLKFLALGPALLALALWSVALRRSGWRPSLLDWLILAGIIAALLPFPTWRQYWLPALPALFVRLAVLMMDRPPQRPLQRPLRIAAVVLAVAGLAPSVEALAKGIAAPPMTLAIREGATLRAAMDSAGVRGPVITLSPQFLPPTGRRIDPRFATGPFYFRSSGLLDDAAEDRLRLVSIARTGRLAGDADAIVTGGEGRWTSGEPSLDTALEAWAMRQGWQQIPLKNSQFRLFVRPSVGGPARQPLR